MARVQVQGGVDVAEEVDVHHAIEDLGVLEAEELEVSTDASVEDQDVHATEFLDCLFD